MGKKGKIVEEYIAKLPPAQQEIVRSLRKTIRQAAPKLGEAIKWQTPCYSGSSNVCSIAAFKNHVNLHFFQGAELTDKQGVLEGTGKGMRHVKVHSAKEIPNNAIAGLVKQAAAVDRG